MGKGGKAGRNPVALLRGDKSVDDLFNELDDDGSGTIEREELRTLLTQLGRPAGNKDLDRVMCAIDADGSGEVELSEFKIWWAAETGTEEPIEWTVDPVTGEEGYFDGNNVWVIAGWVDEGGYYIEPAGQKNPHGKWCANGLLDCYAADGKYVETGHYVVGEDGEEYWEKVPGEYDSQGRWVPELLQLPGTAAPDGDAQLPPLARTASEAAERPRKPKSEFTSVEDAYAKIVEKESVEEMLATARRVNAEMKRAVEQQNAVRKIAEATRWRTSGEDPRETRFVRKDKNVPDKQQLPGTVLDDGDRICIEDASGGGGAWNDVPFALLFLAVVGWTVALAVKGLVAERVEEQMPPACETGPCLNGATCVDVLQQDGFANFTCTCAFGFSGRRCTDAMAWLVTDADTATEAGSATGLEEDELSLDELPLREMTSDDVVPFVSMVVGSAAGSCVIATLWLLLLRIAPAAVVWSTLVSFVLAQLAFGVWLLLGGNGFGILVVLVAGFSSLLCVILRRWFPFAVSMLSLAMEILKRNPLLCDVGAGTVLIQMIFIAIWCLASTGVMLQSADGNMPVMELSFLLVSLFWTAQVVKNVAHVTVAGVAASWYFDTQEENQRPLRASLKRAVTSSFGSICLGSLFVALLRALNTLNRVDETNRTAGQRSNFTVVACRAALRAYGTLFSRLLPLFNQYAFTQIAIYGLSYSAAAKASFNMVKVGGLGPLISNTLLLSVIAVGSVWCGMVAAAVGILIAHTTPITTDEFYGVGFLPRWAVGVLCFLIGVAVSLPGVESVEATITALFVCYAREPNYLEMRRPAAAKQVEEAFSMIAAGQNEDSDDIEEYEDDEDGDYDSEYEEGP